MILMSQMPATGRNFENSVVAVSSSLLDTLNQEEIEGVQRMR